MEYPHQSGDVTVLGPEVFIDQAREVICYQGQNYYRVLPLPEAIHFYEGSTHAVSHCRPEWCGLEPGEQVQPEPTDKAGCPRCLGCGQVADSEDAEPWSAWADLPPGSDLAVRMGLVKPVDCPECHGTGTADAAPERVED